MVFFEVFLTQARRNYGIDNYARPSQTNHSRAVKMVLVGESQFFNHYVFPWLWNIGNENDFQPYVIFICMKKLNHSICLVSSS